MSFGTVTFDQHNPALEAGRKLGARKYSTVDVDYSPLPRLTRKTAFMALVISLGGMMYVESPLGTYTQLACLPTRPAQRASVSMREEDVLT